MRLRPATNQIRRELRTVVLRTLVLLACVRPAGALNVTGVLLQALDGSGNTTDVVWHTSSDPAARPLGFTRAPPRLACTFPLANDENGEVDRWFTPGVNIVSLFWQYRLGEFPPGVVLNVYFNGDDLTPGISATIPAGRGMTQVRINPAPTTLSLYLRDAANPNTLVYDNASERAQLGAGFYMAGAGPDDAFWQLGDFMKIDRVGLAGFTRDGWPDGVLVFELIVGPSLQPSPLPTLQAQPGMQAGPVAVPVAQVGEDLWVAPTPDQWIPGTSTPLRTPAPEPSGSEHTPTPARSAELDSTPTTPTTGSVTPGAGVPSTPTPAQTRSRTATPGTPTPASGRPDETATPGATTPDRSP